MGALAVFVGDIHGGSTVALCPPQFQCRDQLYPANPAQLWLWHSCWLDFVERVKAAARGRKIILILGGDLRDGARHHGTFQTFGTQEDQINCAVEILRPLANISEHIYGIAGTPCHGGESGSGDAKIIQELGGKTDYRWRLEIEGRLFDVAHHSRRDTTEWTYGNACLKVIRQTQFRCRKSQERAPDYVVRFHVHKYDQLTHEGMTAAACPSWQLQTEHGRKLDAANIDDVGGLLWDKDNGLREVLYHPAPDPVTVVPVTVANEY